MSCTSGCFHNTAHIILFSAVDLKNQPGSIYSGEPKGIKPGCILTLSDDNFVGLVAGDLNPQQVKVKAS